MERASPKPKQWDYAATLVVSLAFFLYVATHRMVDDDEGFYALAGRALFEGEIPYRDFFFPQMPLTPVLYGAVRALFGPGLLPLRYFAALLATGTTLLVHHAARRETGPAAGLLAATIFLFHTLTWEWAGTVKTFPVALFFGTLAMVVATGKDVGPRGAFVAGLACGLSVAARLLAASTPFFILLALHRPGRRSLHGWALLGFAVALLPVAWFALADLHAFRFDNVLYHRIASVEAGAAETFRQRSRLFRELFLSPFGAARPDVTGLQTTPLFLLALAVIGRLRRAQAVPINSPPVLFLGWAVFSLFAMGAPYPWLQYAALAIPGLAVAVGVSAAMLARSRLHVAVPALAYVLSAWLPFRDRVVDADVDVRPATMDGVGRALDDVTNSEGRVGAHFPAYLVASTRSIVPAAEDQFARRFTHHVAESERVALHLYSESDLRDQLLAPTTGAFVVGLGVVPETALAVKDAGFVRVRDFPGATIWARPRGAP